MFKDWSSIVVIVGCLWVDMSYVQTTRPTRHYVMLISRHSEGEARLDDP